MDHPTLSFPFGRDVDTLILCRDEDQRRTAIRALAIKAQYETISSALTGSRFKRIIVVAGKPDSVMECNHFEEMKREYLPTKLTRDGELLIL